MKGLGRAGAATRASGQDWAGRADDGPRLSPKRGGEAEISERWDPPIGHLTKRDLTQAAENFTAQRQTGRRRRGGESPKGEKQALQGLIGRAKLPPSRIGGGRGRQKSIDIEWMRGERRI